MEKRKRFHHALLRLYCPLPSKQQPLDIEASLAAAEEKEPVEVPSIAAVGSDVNPELEEAEDEGPQKLTRAQRKRMRKRMLKEAISTHRRTIIGPLFPSAYDGDRQDEFIKGSMEPSPEKNCKIMQV